MAFQRLERDESYTANLVAPAIFVARSRADAQRFSGLTAGVGAAQEVDFDTTLVVAVFRGQVPSGGHGISVARIDAGADVRVTVELTSPAGAASDVLSYPYELVTIDKGPLPDRARWVMVGPDGSILAETQG